MITLILETNPDIELRLSVDNLNYAKFHDPVDDRRVYVMFIQL